MFCRKCGAPLNENAQFCPKCGATTLQTAGASAGGNVAQASKKRKIPYLAIGAIVVALLVVLLLIRAIFGGGGYKKAIDRYFKAIEKQDGGKFIETMIPQKVIKKMDKDEKSDFEDMVEQAFGYFGEDDKVKIEYKILDTEKLDKSELKDINELAERMEDKCDVKLGKIKTAKKVHVKVTIYVNGDKEGSDKTDIPVVKIGGKWYVWYGMY